jgi:uncharacterized protein (TIGR03382 family)
MPVTCDFQQPFESSNAMPWVDAFCYVDDDVPEGCPVHVVTADPAPTNWNVARYHGYNDPITNIPSTATAQGTTTEQVSGGGGTCGFASFTTPVQFTRYVIDAPALVQGDTFFITYTTTGQRADGANGAPPISAAVACPSPIWPTSYTVTCGFGGDAGPIGSDPVDEQPPSPRGCSAVGDPSLAAALSLLAFAARRRRR